MPGASRGEQRPQVTAVILGGGGQYSSNLNAVDTVVIERLFDRPPGEHLSLRDQPGLHGLCFGPRVEQEGLTAAAVDQIDAPLSVLEIWPVDSDRLAHVGIIACVDDG